MKGKSPPNVQKGPSRKYFHGIGPTFSIAPPTAKLQLQFLDDADPVKKTIVRKKARAWVKQNKERESAREEKSWNPRERSDEVTTWTMVLTPLSNPSAGRVDPFNMLPSVGRKVDHIIKYCKSSNNRCFFPVLVRN